MEAFSCQPLFDRLTHVAIKTGAINDFAKLTTSLEKIKFCWNNQVTYDEEIVISFRNEIQQILEVLYRQCPEHGKSESLAIQAKDKGSKAYLKKKDAEAHLNYTESLRLAPENSTVLPVTYGNRSAVLFQMGRYKESLEDMDRAEKCGYPSSIFHKLLARRCSCHIMLGRKDQAELALDACKKHLLVIHSEAKDKFEKTVTDLEHKVYNLCSKSDIKLDDEVDPPHLFQGENPKVTYMSSALGMRVNESCGRHVVATEPICRGSVGFVEKPYAAILLPEHHFTHCHCCFSLITNPLPCQKCRDAVFCKEECRERGLVWHQYECGILHILSAVGIAHLALRVILITGWKVYCKISNEDIKEMTAGVNRDNVYNDRNIIDGYRAVFHLMPHLDSSLPEDQLQYCLAAVLLASAILDRTSFSRQNSLDDDGDRCSPQLKNIDVVHLATAVMRHIAQLVSNAHAVTQIVTDNCSESKKLEEVTQKRIASAIYSTASLMNHSCQPNIINSFFNDWLIIRTIQDVKPDDQIYNCYGPHYCRQTFQERQESLKLQYFFTCKCGPCTQPHYKLKEAAWSGFHCEQCGGISSWTGGEDMVNSDMRSTQGLLVCLECHRTEKPSQHFVLTCTKVSALQEAAEEALQSGDLSTAVVNLRKAVKVGSKVYLAENYYFVTLRDTLAKTLGDAGEFESCCQELKVCLHAAESRYGSESVELAHELLKFSDVLALAATSNDKFHGEFQKATAKIDKIFTLNYGPQWKKYLKI